tara:strand:- start:176 stop:769 length:594 start_codon:yes stop_codon:yes gene_type:complete
MKILGKANKRIAVVGAHGVGKNTICIKLLEREKFSHRGANVTYMPETVRSTMFMDHEILGKEIGGNYYSVSWLFHRHWSQMLEHEYSCDVFISKRLPLDYVVFNKVAVSLGMCDRELETEYKHLAINQAKEFDEVWFVRHNPEHDMIEDSVRQGAAGSASLQPLWDEYYKVLIDSWDIPVIEGTCGELLALHFGIKP